MLKIPLLVPLGHHRPEKSCVFAATVLDPSDTQRQTRTGRPFSVLSKGKDTARFMELFARLYFRAISDRLPYCHYPGTGPHRLVTPISDKHSTFL